MASLKLGKTPARPGAVKFKLTDYLALPKPPAKYGHYSLIPSWGMLGNDQYGDCVWAGAGHEVMLWNKEANRAVLFTDQDVLSDYSAVTGFNPNDPNSDQGTDMTVAASYRRKTGVTAHGLRHKVLAYLALPVGDTTQLKQAVYLFGAVGVGIQFPASAMTQFNNGKPWSVTSSAIEGGHYIPCVGYDSKYFYVVTWGKVQKCTYGFIKKYMDEAIAYLSAEMLTNNKSLEGFDLTALQGDLQSL
jgi:hypothetical protein